MKFLETVLILFLKLKHIAVKRAFYDKYGEEKLKEGFFSDNCKYWNIK